jgi:aminoglycoside/choline kinase family phosphotransferase
LIMNEVSDTEILQRAKTMLVDNGMLSKPEFESLLTGNQCSKLESDGSTRRFWRLGREGRKLCIIAAPAGRDKEELAESRSVWKIGNHLRKKGVPVPELYGWDRTTGVLLFEDLGDLRLHDIVRSEEKDLIQHKRSVFEYYRSALEHLAVMQCKGADDFAKRWCWDSPRYDIELMVERESGYFLRAFWQGLMGRKVDEGVEEELLQIARLASAAPPDFFLHRDFQSRNIMIKDGAVRFIDFQGGRLGPLGYDVASLLIDPYSSLSTDIQEELRDIYLDAVNTHLPVLRSEFEKQFKLLAFQRNMQIVGAFSFLYKVRKKMFFMDFIKPALLSLHTRMQDPLFMDFPLVGTMVSRGVRELTAA